MTRGGKRFERETTTVIDTGTSEAVGGERERTHQATRCVVPVERPDAYRAPILDRRW